MSKIIGRMGSKSVDQVWHSSALEIVAELNQMLLEQRTLTINLLVGRVEHRQLGGADREARLGILRSQRDRLAIAVLRLLVAVHRHETVATVHQCIDIIGPDREGPVIACERIFDAPDRLQSKTEIAARLYEVGPNGQRLRIAGQRLLVTAQLIERMAAIVERFSVIRLERQRSVG